MSTIAQYAFYGADSNDAVELMKQAFIDCERHCNIFNPTSEISQLNQTASDTPFICSPYLFNLLLISEKYYLLSDGGFDVTSRPLMQLWGFHRKQENPILPTKAMRDSVLKLVGFNKLTLNYKNKSVHFSQKLMNLDLGAIAKGYAVDCAMDSIMLLNIDTAIVDLGGNIRVYSKKPNSIPIGVVDERNPEKKHSQKVYLSNEAVATSGNYHRFVKINGKNYTHIMNPKTAIPVENINAVTVIASRAVDADAASTAIFVGGEKVKKKLLKEKKIKYAEIY